jgi:tetratricopeptide (TPR) repeat protein
VKKTVAISILCWLLALVLGMVIAHRMPISGEQGATNLLNLLFGESRTLISHKMYETADLYFHKGVGHEHGDHEHGHEHDGHTISERGDQESDPLNEDYEHEHEHEHEHEFEEGHTEANDWLSRLGHELKPSGHKHLSDERQEKEILPWIWMSVKSDPHNVLAYDTGAFFLAERLGKPEEALKLLGEGIKNNPEAIDLYFARGEILYHVFHRTEEALASFEKGQELWQKEYDAWADAPKDSEIEQPPSKRNYRLLNYMGILRGDLGDMAGALVAYKKALGFAPTPHTYQATLEKIEELETVGAGIPLP